MLLVGGDGHSSVMYVRLGFEQSEESLAVQEITDKITNFNIETDTEANINTDTGNVCWRLVLRVFDIQSGQGRYDCNQLISDMIAIMIADTT